jgi:hypothetical protein
MEFAGQRRLGTGDRAGGACGAASDDAGEGAVRTWCKSGLGGLMKAMVRRCLFVDGNRAGARRGCTEPVLTIGRGGEMVVC